MIDEDTRTAILRLHAQGHGSRKISRALGIARDSVRRIISSGSSAVPPLVRAERAEPWREHSPAKLIEVTKFTDLPSGLNTWLLNSDYADGGEGPNAKCCEFLVGGVSTTSALVAYELFGYVPSYRAIAFVRINAAWVKAAEWNIGPASTLKILQEETSHPPEFW